MSALSSFFVNNMDPDQTAPTANKMNPDQTAPKNSLIRFHIVCHHGGSIMERICIYAADVPSRQHFQDKKVLISFATSVDPNLD